MYGVGASGGLKNHFSQDEEDALKKDESSTSIVRRDTKSTVDISGSDRTWRAEKEHQKSVGENGLAAVEHTVHAAAEGAEMAGLEIFGAGVLAAASPVLGAALALRLGLGELNEAHVRGEDQAIALARDNGHVALVGALDLPDSYKTKRLEGDFAHVSKGPNTPSGKMTQGVMNQKGDLATLQLHADRGMNAARDLSRSGAKVEAFLAANPKIAETYRKDPAFREGFDAYLHTKATQPAAAVANMDAKLNERDGWYAQSHVQFRV